MNAPNTPIKGTILSLIFSFNFFAQKAMTPSAPAQKAPPTAGESKASDMCMTCAPPENKKAAKASRPDDRFSLRGLLLLY
jgi:hypothetical protein